MSERDVYIECIPMIAEIIVLCREMSSQEYEDWKREVMENVSDKAKEFMRKVLICIDSIMTKERRCATWI